MNTSLIYEKSCSVFGHNKIEFSENLKEILKSVFKNLILKEQVRYFYFGGFGEFDDLCWQVVTELKREFPNIYRIYCLSDPRHQKPSKRPKWLKAENYEEIVYLDLMFDYWYSRIYYRNCRIIELSDFVIFYVNHSEHSGAYKAMQYNMRKKIKKTFVNLCSNIT